VKKILLTIFLVLSFWNCSVLAKPILPDAEENQIQIFFLNPLKQKRPENKCNSTACKALLENIKKAQESIDFAIYGIKDQDKIFNALVKAQKRGVKIRWVTDLNEKNRNIYYDTYDLMHKIPTYNTDYISQQKEAERTANYEFPQTAIMHNKFFIFDNKKVFTGSTNISSYCLTGYNSNVAVLIDSTNIASIYKQEFEQMYNGKFHNEKSAIPNNENIKLGDINISVYFSPINKTTTEQILPLIKNAKSYIYIPAFYLTRKSVIYELIEAKKRGVDIKIIVDETSVKGKYVDIDFIKKNKIDIKTENWLGKMHMKSIIIDDESLVIGSMNFTKQGENVNDENCLIIENVPILTKKYKEHFLELWNSIK
jgi:phosphatidylserine/phosphatidylglycerophosphate/cardiolipin synthase-like enzyme